MRLCMTLLVRDEIDIIRYNLEHHLSHGVDFFIITDNGSVDGTREVIQEYVDKGLAVVIDEPDHTYEQGRWVTRMYERAVVLYGADAVINADADEFWCSPDNNLKSEFKQFDNTLFEVPMTLVVGEGDFPFVKGRIVPMPPYWGSRTMLRAMVGVTIGQGNHSILDKDGKALPLKKSEYTSVIHLPWRSYEQFEKKVVNGGSSYEANTRFSEYTGIHWREWYRDYKNGKLPDTYRRLTSYSDTSTDIWLGCFFHD